MPIDYAPYVQKAFQGLVKNVLQDVAKNGMPDGSHFFITFQTNRQDVKIPDFVRAKYPQEMSIILQYQFDDLVVDGTAFSVTLTFGGVASRLVIPYTALISFTDPETEFGFAFTPTVPEKLEKSAEVIDFNSLRKK